MKSIILIPSKGWPVDISLSPQTIQAVKKLLNWVSLLVYKESNTQPLLVKIQDNHSTGIKMVGLGL